MSSGPLPKIVLSGDGDGSHSPVPDLTHLANTNFHVALPITEDDPMPDAEDEVRHSSVRATTCDVDRAYQSNFQAVDTNSRVASRARTNNEKPAKFLRRHTVADHYNDLAGQVAVILSKHKESGSQKSYFPNESLTDLVANLGAVQAALCAPNTTEVYTESIRFSQNNPRIFALVLLSLQNKADRLEAVRALEYFNLGDACLPVNDLQDFNLCPPLHRRRGSDDDESHCTHKEQLQAFHYRPWTVASFKSFYDNQWSFCVAKFDRNNFIHHLHGSMVLPFPQAQFEGEVVPEVIGQGSFGEVTFLNMLASHQTVLEPISGQRVIAVARKEFIQAGVIHNSRENWLRESRALQIFNEIDNPQIVRGIGAYSQGNRHFIIMERAERGDLTKIWDRNPDVHQDFSGELVMEFLQQFRGLARALQIMHNYELKSLPGISGGATLPSGPTDNRFEFRRLAVPTINAPASKENWRHGDLKPENILSFEDNASSLFGTLKLADLGRAKQHVGKTADRSHTLERFSTWDYGPPEIWINQEAQRSRFVDIWSFGCVLLECLIWLLFGHAGLLEFMKKQSRDFGSLYWSISGIHNRTAQRNSTTAEWLDRLRENDPEFRQRESDSAVRDLLNLIDHRLLVVDYPDDYDSDHQEGKRINSETLVLCLDEMIRKGCKSQNYLFSGNTRLDVSIPTIAQVGTSKDKDTDRLLTPNVRMSGANVVQRRTRAPWQARGFDRDSQANSYSHEFDNKWQYVDDTDFATRLLGLLKVDFDHLLLNHNLLIMCNNCSSNGLEASKPDPDSLLPSYVGKVRRHCEQCAHHLNMFANVSEVDFTGLVGTAQPECLPEVHGMAVFRQNPRATKDEQTPTKSSHLQLYLPVLPQGGSQTHFKIINAWLDECDKNHAGCRSSRPVYCPTRLLNVGTVQTPTLRLLESSTLTENERKSIRYIALSYPWGQHPPHGHVVTNAKNRKTHMTDIPGELPQTLADAVLACRLLGITYLWVDSLCIIQGSGGDFANEADRMEAVFSCAYCVIAASSAEGSSSGFLKRTSRRGIDAVAESIAPFHAGNLEDGNDDGPRRFVLVDEEFDDFEKDVLQAPLNQRGWVFQERALARRTIHFTNNQTYFECGDGIRCETLTKMRNTHVGFLGDPNFPGFGLQGSKGADIIFFQDLYEEYSKKLFTNIEDRPFAISGLEQRLCEALSHKNNSRRGYWGIVNDHWGRSLLWQRAPGVEKMIRLMKGPSGGHAAPSWSWEGFSGAIKYLKPEFRTVQWHDGKVLFPWSTGSGHGSHMNTASYQGGLQLKGSAFDFSIPESKLNDRISHDIVFDDCAESLQGSFKVLTLGYLRLKDTPSQQVRNFVLVIRKKPFSGDDIFERVGAGFLTGSMICFDQGSKKVLIE